MNVHTPLSEVVARALGRFRAAETADELKWAWDYFTGMVDGYFYAGAADARSTNAARNTLANGRAIARQRVHADPWPSGEFPMRRRAATPSPHAELDHV